MTLTQRIAMVLLVVGSIFVFLYPFSSAHAGFGLTFGGMIIVKIDGLCEEGSWIILGPNGRPGSYMYVAGTTTYQSGPPSTPRQQILGLTQGFLTCSKQVGPYRVLFGTYPLIGPIHGTSPA